MDCAARASGSCGDGSERPLKLRIPARELSVHVQKQLSGRRQRRDSISTRCAIQLAAGFTILFGASGAGKTTVLDCIAGLQKPDSGRIAVGDATLFDSEKGIDLPARAAMSAICFRRWRCFRT